MGSPLLVAAIAAGATLFGVTLQWALGQLSAYMILRRENAGRLNAVLAELLEIRHELLVQSKARDPAGFAVKVLSPEQLEQIGPLPPELGPMVVQWITPILPDARVAVERYETAVTLLATLDPALSYRLRNKSIVLHLSRSISEFGTAAGAPPNMLALLQETVAEELVPILEEVILDVAADSGGWWRRRSVRALMKRSPVSDEELQQLLQRLIARLLKAFGAAEIAVPPVVPTTPSPTDADTRSR